MNKKDNITQLRIRLLAAGKNKNGTIVLMTLLMLTSVLIVTLGSASVVASGILISRTQERSTKAYFAAEAGAERSLWEARKNNFALPQTDQNNIFANNLSNGSDYSVNYATSSTNIIFASGGYYLGTRRMIEVSLDNSVACVSNCSGKACGDNDGCGGACPTTCATGPGCSSSPITNAGVTPESCCAGDCYECNSGYIWDGTACVSSCVVTCASSVGCSASAVTNASITGAECCAGSCYECDAGYTWNGAACVPSNWLSGPCAGILVYNADVAGTKKWKTTATSCDTPQCGLDGAQNGDNLVADNAVDFSLYPARDACKSVGGRLPTSAELSCIYTNKASYGVFHPDNYWSSTEYGLLRSWPVNFSNGSSSSSNKTNLYSVRCVL